ncbi:MAG TPA: discoidin domain-containing protein, partial [Phnomibacter sp.]|nr:discoidin domain-containing protein [Phnomibacter sp.]
APQSITIDMGQTHTIYAFTYLPRQTGPWGIVKNYQWEASLNGGQWQTLAQGEFANILANPVEQLIPLASPVQARYFRFTGLTAAQHQYISAAELGVIGQPLSPHTGPNQ